MAEERLEIILEADVKSAIANIQGASDALKNLGINGAKNLKQLEAGLAELRKLRAGAETAADLNQINAAIASLSAQAARLRKPLDDAAVSVSKVGKGAANANPALVNFGRVVQDAPFGLIGIANNIDPLISSFQSLQKSTGSTGGALKALGGALLGPAGIGIAISAVTSALIVFGPAIGRAIAGISEFDQTLRDAGTKGAEAFSKAQESFGNFVRIVNDSEASTARQNAAFDAANKALSEYGLQVGSIGELQKQGSQIGAIYAQIKQEEARSSILAAKAAEEYAKGVALGIAVEQGDVFGAAGALSAGDLIKTLFGGATAAADFATGIGNAFSKAKTSEELYRKENEKVKLGIDSLIKSLGQVPGVVEKSDKARTKSVEVSRKAAEQETIINTQREKAILLTNQETAGLLALSQAADKAFAAKQKTSVLDKQKNIQAAGGATGLPGRGIDPAILKAQENFALLQEDAQQTANIIGNTLGPAVDSVFNALANGENIFKALGESVKGLVIELVKAVAKALILQAVLSLVTGGGSAAAGAAGGGGFIGKLFGGVFGGRAGGGSVLPGGGYIVGESGPETFYPSQPGSIVPNAGAMGGGELTAKFSGNTLLFAVSMAARNNRMNFG
jgi:hypothetical protein